MIKAHDLRRNSLREPRQTESTLDSGFRELRQAELTLDSGFREPRQAELTFNSGFVPLRQAELTLDSVFVPLRRAELTPDSERRTPTRHINHLITNKRKDSIMINLNAKQFPDQ